MLGSPTVNVNGRPALRVEDKGVHAACCGPNMWTAQKGAPSVFINGKAAFRLNDMSKHCGGVGQLVQGSSDVIVGDSGGGGGGGGAGAGGGSSGSSGTGGTSGSSGTSSDSASSGSSTSAASRTNTKTAAAQSKTEPASDPDATRTDQIEIQLVSSNGNGRGNVRYELTLPDGTKQTGTSDAAGWIRVSGLTQTGDCTLSLPEFDTESA